MNREELKEKISEISNSEFPLIDFFNDIGWLEGSKWFNTEKAYEDIEKIYNVFVYYKDKVKKTEKELKQTKLNFKNSQIHSKNCYKKLKEKYTRLERAYKNNEVMTRDLNELINRNLELKDELKRCQETIESWCHNHKKLIIDNGKMKKAITILEDRKHILKYNGIDGALELGWLTQKEYELLKEVFESVGGRDD